MFNFVLQYCIAVSSEGFCGSFILFKLFVQRLTSLRFFQTALIRISWLTFSRPNLTRSFIKRRDTGQFSVLWFQQLLTCFSVLWSNFLFSKQWFGFHTFTLFPFLVLLWWPIRKEMIFCIIFIIICHRNGYNFHWKTRGGFLKFALIDVEAS